MIPDLTGSSTVRIFSRPCSDAIEGGVERRSLAGPRGTRGQDDPVGTLHRAGEVGFTSQAGGLRPHAGSLRSQGAVETRAATWSGPGAIRGTGIRQGSQLAGHDGANG
jgi:hypothetical protein